jgi:hypothetical protein
MVLGQAQNSERGSLPDIKPDALWLAGGLLIFQRHQQFCGHYFVINFD